jgi:hypothetical protein
MIDSLDLAIAAADLLQAARAIEDIRDDLGRLTPVENEELLAMATRLRLLARKIAVVEQRFERLSR